MIYILTTVCSMSFAIIAEILRISYKKKVQLINNINTYIELVFHCKNNKIRVQYPKKNQNMFFSEMFAIMASLPLICVSAIRYNVGTDFKPYWQMYINNGEKNGRGVEPGYTLLVHFLRLFSKNPQFFFIVSSIIVCGLYFYTMYRESESFPISVFLFVTTREYFRQMNGVRQYLAVALILLALPCLKKKKWIKVIILTLLAASFHYSAVVFLMFAVLYQINFTPMLLLLVSICTFVLSVQAKVLLLPLINKYTDFGTYFLSSSNFSDSHFEKLTFLSFVFLMLIAAFVLGEKKGKISEEFKLYSNGIFIGLLFYALSASWPTTINRFGWYANIFITLYFPHVLFKMKSQAMRWCIMLFIMVFFGVWCFIQISRGNQSVIPYQTFSIKYE